MCEKTVFKLKESAIEDALLMAYASQSIRLSYDLKEQTFMVNKKLVNQLASWLALPENHFHLMAVRRESKQLIKQSYVQSYFLDRLLLSDLDNVSLLQGGVCYHAYLSEDIYYDMQDAIDHLFDTAGNEALSACATLKDACSHCKKSCQKKISTITYSAKRRKVKEIIYQTLFAKLATLHIDEPYNGYPLFKQSVSNPVYA